MASLSTTPASPIPGRPFRVAVTATAGGNAVRVWCSAAPPGSKLRRELDTSQASRISVATCDAGKFFELTVDKGGGYVFELNELQVGSGFSGGYEGDARGAPSEEILSTGEAIVYVASAISQTIGAGNDRAELRLFVLGDTIIGTTVEQHGQVTPRVELGAQATPRARSAAEATATKAAVAALAGITASAALGSLSAVLADLALRYGRHIVRSPSHAAIDTNNGVTAANYAVANSASGLSEGTNLLRAALGRHVRNEDTSATPGGTGSAAYHTAGALISWAALPLASLSAGEEPAGLIAALVDLWRAYAAHRVSSVHTAPDNSNAALALPPLLEAHRQFLDQLAALSPTNPPTGHSAETLLSSSAGFKQA